MHRLLVGRVVALGLVIALLMSPARAERYAFAGPMDQEESPSMPDATPVPTTAAPAPETSEPAPPVPPGATGGTALAAARVVSMRVLPDMRIGAVQNALLPGSMPDDHRILMGGVGSDLWHGPDDPPDELWMVTDRGPGGQGDNGKERAAFALAEYTPMILHVRLGNSTVDIIEIIPIVGRSGQPVTGLPNLAGRDDRPVDARGKVKLPFNPSGLDPEGLARTADGSFWIAEEYGPSLVHLDAGGMVLKRFVPSGLVLAGTDYPVVEALPGVFAKRADEGGFEGLTVSADGMTLYLAMQSPLSNPNDDIGDRSRNTRILVFDIASEQVTAEYVYRLESSRSFDPTKKIDPDNLKLSALAMSGDGRLLVLERTGKKAHLYLADFGEATNVLATRWDDLAANPSLESIQELAIPDVRPLRKSLVIDLDTIRGVPDKLEGIAILDATTVVVANDNDFDIGKVDKDGDNRGNGQKSSIVTVSLDRPLTSP